MKDTVDSAPISIPQNFVIAVKSNEAFIFIQPPKEDKRFDSSIYDMAPVGFWGKIGVTLTFVMITIAMLQIVITSSGL